MGAPKSKKLKTIQLVAIIFLTVSGGPYGLEPLLEYAGTHGALLLLLVTPILWDFPSIAMILELNSMMPVEGGYYQWVKRALGLRFAWYEGWWTWLYSFVDLAIYPVLFVEYFAFFFPEITSYKTPICLAIIWLSGWVNIRGIVSVGKISMVLAVVVLIPFIFLFGSALINIKSGFHFPTPSFKHTNFSSISLALYTIMWNFIGWDNITTYAGEVQKPIRSYLVSIGGAFILTVSIYFIAVFIAIQSGIDVHVLTEKGYPALGELIAGKWLGALIAVGGMASALGLYGAVLLSVSRIPKEMAEDNLLPRFLHKLHPTFQTPYVSIITCSSVVSFMILWKFADLLVIDITIYGAGLFLEFISLIVFRIKLPNETRPFKIPLNVFGLCIMVLFPLTVYVVALVGAFSGGAIQLWPAIFAVIALFSAEVIWQVIIWRKPELKRL